MSTAAAPGRNFRDVKFENIIVPALQKKDSRLTSTPVYRDPQTGQTGPLAIQTPPVRLPFGFSKSEPQESGKVGYSVNGAFDDMSNGGLPEEWYKWCCDFENYALALAAHNSEQWFGEKTDAKTCRMLMNKWVKKSKDPEKAKKYAPTFKGTVREKFEKDANGNQVVTEKKQFWSRCRDETGNEIDITSLSPNDKVSMKLKLSSFYLINGKFGFTWDVEWVAVIERSAGQVFDYNPNMYGELPAPSIPSAGTTTPDASLTSPVNTDTTQVPPADEKNAEGKRVPEPSSEEPTTSSKRSRKN